MKTKMIFKNMLMVGAFLLLAGAAQPAMAQQTAEKPVHCYVGSSTEMQVGDTIMINPDSLYYLTKERMSKWVYKVPHTIQQVGGKRYPYGILIAGIYSWVYPGSLIPTKEVEPITPPAPPAPDTIKLEPVIIQDTIRVVVHDTVKPDTINDTKKDLYRLDNPYEVNRYSVGLRGGFASNLTNANGISLGGDVLLDFRYAHYWAKNEQEPEIGFMTGLSFGYVGARQNLSINDNYTLTTPYDGDIRYNVTVDKVSEMTNQLQLEIPLMFSMQTQAGFFLNAGPKFIIPVYSNFNQKMEGANIAAYLEEMNGRPIYNNPVTGMFSEDQFNLNGSFKSAGSFTLALAAELGYQFNLRNGHSIDLGAYIDYSLYSTYRTYGNSPVVTIEPPTHLGAAVVDVKSLTEAHASKFGLFDVGVRVAYNLDFSTLDKKKDKKKK